MSFFNNKQKQLTEIELLQKDIMALESFEKQSYIQNNMLKVHFTDGQIIYYSSEIVKKYTIEIESLKKPNQEGYKYSVIIAFDDYEGFTQDWYTKENAEKFADKMAELLQKIN